MAHNSFRLIRLLEELGDYHFAKAVMAQDKEEKNKHIKFVERIGFEIGYVPKPTKKGIKSWKIF